MIAFVVRGLPVPQGSPRAFVHDGRATVVSGATGAGSHGRTLADWRRAIATEARAAIGDRPLLAGPVRVDLIFVLARPKTHFRAGGTLRPSAPVWVTTRPDGDKLERAAWDALSGVIVRDDAVIAAWSGRKRYADLDGWTGVHVYVTELKGFQAAIDPGRARTHGAGDPAGAPGDAR